MVIGASFPAAFRLGFKTPMFLGLPLLLEHRVPLRLLLDEVGGHRRGDTSPALGATLIEQLADSQEGVEPGSPCASSIAVVRRISFSYPKRDAQFNWSIVAKTSAISHSASCSWYDRSRVPMLLSEAQVP